MSANGNDTDMQKLTTEYQKQSQMLDHKIATLATRKRMLEISEEKNIHKQKVIYSYLSLILAIAILMIAVYMMYSS